MKQQELTCGDTGERTDTEISEREQGPKQDPQINENTLNCKGNSMKRGWSFEHMGAGAVGYPYLKE